MNLKKTSSSDTVDLRRRAEARLRAEQRHRSAPARNRSPGCSTSESPERGNSTVAPGHEDDLQPEDVLRSKAGNPQSEADTQRQLHELQVHQIELEMQNEELKKARDEIEADREKYSNLYDFAPVGYFSLDEQGRILEANLTGAALLGQERSRLINRRLSHFLAPASQPIFLAFLKSVFAGPGKKVCEAALLKEDGAAFWVNFHGTPAISLRGGQTVCQVAASDITASKLVEEAQRHAEAMADANRELKRTIERRQEAEEALKQSERQLRLFSHQILQAQEEERKRISRELHDVIAQTLTGINIRLANLKKEASLNPKGLDQTIASTQLLVEKSVNIVHDFARELRPAVLDDLGLIPALHAFMKHFMTRTGVHTRLTACKAVEKLDPARRMVFFRVAQEAFTNVDRHAGATRVEVSIRKLSDRICMKIHDDGKSFEFERAMPAQGSKRLGLLGMRERLEMVGGRFDIESAAGKGTTIIAEIPFDKPGGAKKKSAASEP
jgi:PAS domain S-box-containing protein